jgi:hypothetical protein
MVKLRHDTMAEKTLIPAFVFFFLMLYPPGWIARADRRIAGAAGGCILIRPAALERIGGLPAIRSQIIDDCALARAVKHAGGSIWLGLTRSARSTRSYGSFAEIGRMISRTAFNQLRHSYTLLTATIAGLVLTYLLPPLLLLSGQPVVDCARRDGLDSHEPHCMRRWCVSIASRRCGVSACRRSPRSTPQRPSTPPCNTGSGAAADGRGASRI